MCGISGYILDKIPEKIDTIFHHISHRGPDDSGEYKTEINGKFVGLYHRRLSIYDLTKNASQPMSSFCGRNVIIFNGAIYNYKTLLEQLDNSIDLRKEGDTRVLIESITKWGTIETWKKTNGMFAAAVLDKEKKELKIARDRVGQKPLFYTLNPKINGNKFKGIIFASELKAIRELIDHSIDYGFIHEYLTKGRVDSCTNTLFSEIKRLDPASELTVNLEKDTISLESFWNLEQQVNKLVGLSNKEKIITATKEKILDSINMQVTGDRKLGIMLSSGIDSTVLSCLMKETGPENIYSFTYDFEDSEVGESSYSKFTSQNLGLKYITSDPITKEYVRNNLERIINWQDEPITSIRTVAQHYIHEVASKYDCRIIIEGNGGDEIFGGYFHYKFSRLLDRLSDYRQDTSTLKRLIDQNNSQDLMVGLRSILIPGICSKDASEVRKLNVIQNHLINNYSISQYASIRNLEQSSLSFTAKAQLNDLFSIFLPRSLRYVDRSSMASGNEARAPLLDHNVIEHGIASSIFNSYNDSKREVLREMGNMEILNKLGKSKKTIVDPQREWLYGDLFDWALEIIHGSKELLSDYFKYDVLIENLKEEKNTWLTLKKGNSGTFMQAINLAILLK